MTNKTLIFIIILLIFFGLYLVYNYFNQPVVKAPIIETEKKTQFLETPTNSDFRGPTGPPSIKGPSGPPPTFSQ